MKGSDFLILQTRTYYTLPKSRDTSNKGDFTIVVKLKGALIHNAPDRTLLLVETEGHSSVFYYRHRGLWLCISKITDFPISVPKQILGLFTLLKEG